MAQPVKAPSAKPDDLSLTSDTHIVDEKNQLLKIIFNLHTHTQLPYNKNVRKSFKKGNIKIER